MTTCQTPLLVFLLAKVQGLSVSELAIHVNPFHLVQNKHHATCRKERFIEEQTAGLPPSGSECSSSAGMDRGLYRRGHTMRREGVPPREQPDHWPPFIFNCQMERVDTHS
jgi:hypothetical protein